MPYSISDIQADFEINRLIRYQITPKINYSHRRQTGDRRTTIGIFFRKKDKTTKKSILLDMHHHETYMYINFQQNRVS